MHRRIATVAGVRLLVLMAIAAAMLCIGATAASAATLQVQEWRVTNDTMNHGSTGVTNWVSVSGDLVVWDTNTGFDVTGISDVWASELMPYAPAGSEVQRIAGGVSGQNEGTPSVFDSLPGTPGGETIVWAQDSDPVWGIWGWNAPIGSHIPFPVVEPQLWEGGESHASDWFYWPVICGDWLVWTDSTDGYIYAAPRAGLDSPIQIPDTSSHIPASVDVTEVSWDSSVDEIVWGAVVSESGRPTVRSYYYIPDQGWEWYAPVGPTNSYGEPSPGLEQADARISGNRVVYQQDSWNGSTWENDGIWVEDLSSTDAFTQIAGPSGAPTHPDISGDWVVWESASRVYAKNLATGTTGPVSSAGSAAGWPRIDGTTVVWVDRRDQGSTEGTSEIYAAELSEAVDTTPPVTTASGWDQGNHYRALDVTLTCADADSGVDQLYWSTNGENWTNQAYVGSVIVPVTTPNLYFYATDVAGNIEDTQHLVLPIDADAPSIDLPSPDAALGSAERDLYETQPLSSDSALAEANSSMMGDSTIRFSVPGTSNPSEVTVRWANVTGPVEPDLGAASWALAAKQFDAVSQEFTTQIKCTSAGLHAVWIHAVTPLGTSDVIRYYYVKYLSSGLQQPVNLDCTSVFNGSSTIPLKVKILDANGQPVTDIAPKLTVLALHSGAAGSTVESAVDLTAYVDPDDFKYMGNGVWQLNWSAKKNLAKVIGSWSSATIRFSISFTHSPKTVSSTDASFTRCKG